METLSLDLETYSSADLSGCGVYRYTEAPDFEILLLGYSADRGPVQVIDLASGEEVPDGILDALTDQTVTKWAFNVQFERICLSAWLKKYHPERFGGPGYLEPASWKCTMIWSAYTGLPLSLAGAGAALGLEKQKLTEGKELIRYFCDRCKPTKANGGRTQNLPKHAPDRWAAFKAYNIRDVEVEMQIQEKLADFPVPDPVWEEFRLDQEINDRGIAVDTQLVSKAIRMDLLSKKRLTRDMRILTGLKNPNSVAQMKQWLEKKGLKAGTLGKRSVAQLIQTAPPEIAEVLKLRQQCARSSVRKYSAMEDAACRDGRARGMFQFYGASRTGREAGRLIQLQNLPQNHLPDLEQARGLVRAGDYEAVEMLYGDVPDTLAQLIRTAFVSKEGNKFIIADFSSVEARVLSWLAGEQWRIDAFHEGKDIYCESASQMFGVAVEKHGINSGLRQKGKVAELACIARGSPVLTDRGEIPIQYVTKKHRVWDGYRWVKHDGVVFRGFRPICHYDGLSATEDHFVYVEEQSRPVPFGEAVCKGLHLRRKDRQGYSPDAYRGFAATYDVLNAGPDHRFMVSGCLVHNCGYGGSVGALKAMGALEMGLKEEELPPIVDAWREANPHIVRLWWDVDRAARLAVQKGGPVRLKNLKFRRRGGKFMISLPSGRDLFYENPEIGEGRFGSTCITYMGLTGARKWGRLETYGPKIVENITQAVSRDLLMYAMENLRKLDIVAHVHDEIILEVPPEVTVREICSIMGRTPTWAGNLELRADGFESKFYRKDG